MNIRPNRLKVESIENSSEVQTWLKQFPTGKIPSAIDLLLNLRFITRDSFSEWTKTRLTTLSGSVCAIFAVRKLGANVQSIWDKAGNIIDRPASSLGSEDLVQSVISNLIKAGNGNLLDHPSLKIMKESQVRRIVLLDDSIGSGERISFFLKSLMRNKSLLSWWSYGLINVYVIAYSRSLEGSARILKDMAGSDHPLRKYRKSVKIRFVSILTYDEYSLMSRWGSQYQNIIDLCDSINSQPTLIRRGFGGTMSNVIFYHSVPDNVPGMLWYNSSTWRALFPERSIPGWFIELLDKPLQSKSLTGEVSISPMMLSALFQIKKGLRKEGSIARAIGIDVDVVRGVILNAVTSGFLTSKWRLTKAGTEVIWRNNKNKDSESYNRVLYIPKKWCVGRGTVQPFDLERGRTYSTGRLRTVGGEVGQTSLERTDAKTARPSLNVMPHNPSKSRKGHDIHGPRGQKER